ncbi:MAG: 4Fe-4S binding protein [Candidatus Ranarchaeia archaeon]
MTKKHRRVSGIIMEIIKNIFRKPSTTDFPFKPIVPADGYRGKQEINYELCIGCGLCSRDCPAKAIEMVDVDGVNKPLFYLDRCIFCEICAEHCPRDAIEFTKQYDLAVKDKDQLIIDPRQFYQKKTGMIKEAQ